MNQVRARAIETLISLFAVVLAGCGGGGSSASPAGQPGTAGAGSLAVLVQDQPLDNLVKFEITVTSVVLNLGDISVLPQPVELELTSLEMTSELIRLAQNIPAGTYTSVTLTFANPEIKFLDPITGNLVEIQPSLQSGTVTVNVTFTVTAGQTTSLLIDFDLRASVLTDATGNITGINPVVTVSLVNVVTADDELEDVVGRVVSINRTSSSAGTFVLESFANCKQFTFTVDANTMFEDFNPNNFDSLQADQIVEVDADIQNDGTFLAEEVEREDDQPEDEAEGLIIDATRDPVTDAVADFILLLFDVAPCTATLPPQDTVTVVVPTNPAPIFRIDDDEFTVNSALFDDPTDLDVGQKVDVDPVEALGTNPFTAERIKLQDQAIRGTVLSIAGTSFELDPDSDLFPDQSITVETSAATEFDDLPGGVADLTAGQAVRVKGLLFRLSTGQQKLVAKRVDGTP